jgi:hypothetical protein
MGRRELMVTSYSRVPLGTTCQRSFLFEETRPIQTREGGSSLSLCLDYEDHIISRMSSRVPISMAHTAIHASYGS